jgi:hypothetical protein
MHRAEMAFGIVTTPRSLTAASTLSTPPPQPVVKATTTPWTFSTIVQTTKAKAIAQPAKREKTASPSPHQTSAAITKGAVLGASTSDGVVTQSELQTAIEQASNALRQLIYANAGTVGQGQYSSGGYTNSIALSNRIDQLSGTKLSNITVNSVSGLTAADIPTNIVAVNYLPLSGSTMTGPINFSNANTSQLLLGGAPFFTSSSTSLYIGVLSGTSTADIQNTAVGYGTLSSDAIGYSNSAFGFQAMMLNTTGFYNSAFGVSALASNTTGIRNTAVGVGALQFATADANTAVGYRALFLNTTGANNVAVGYGSLATNGSATSTTALGEYTGHGNGIGYSNQGGTYIGYQAGYLANNGSDYNTMLGYNSGYNVTTGSNNLLLSTATSSLAIANLTTGSQNILIGNNISLPSATANGQLDIGNIIYGTGITGTGSTLSSGNIGIGTSSPIAKLDITGNTSDAVLSSEMISAIADRNFSSNTGDWTGTNWTIGANVDTHTAGANVLTLTSSALTSAPASGNIYQVTFTCSASIWMGP